MTKAGAGSGPKVEDGATANPEKLGCYSGTIPQLALFSIPLMTLHPQAMGSVLPGRGVHLAEESLSRSQGSYLTLHGSGAQKAFVETNQETKVDLDLAFGSDEGLLVLRERSPGAAQRVRARPGDGACVWRRGRGSPPSFDNV